MKKIILLFFLIVFCYCGTKNEGDKLVNDLYNRAHGMKQMTEEEKKLRHFYDSVYGERVEEVKKILSESVDPNFCRGDCGWYDSNPLDVTVEGFYTTYYRVLYGDRIPEPTPDLEVMSLLLKAGADIHRRPYVWHRVYHLRKSISDIRSYRKFDNKSLAPSEVQKEMNYYIKDANRVLKAFIDAGADPDKKGHPYPYSNEAMNTGITDEQAKEYFAKGSRPINIAIEKGIVWESQVDLLLKYVKLDDESLKAAERSKDPKMLEKIQKLWEKQNGKK